MAKLIQILFVVVLCQWIAFSQAPTVDSNTLALWHFDEGSGTILHDASPNHNDGTIYDADWIPGKYGSALHFNGKTSYVLIPNNESLKSSKEFTLEGWCFLDTLSLDPMPPAIVIPQATFLSCYGPWPGGGGYGIKVDSIGLQYNHFGNESIFYGNHVPVPYAHNYFHLMVTYQEQAKLGNDPQRALIKVYLNESLVDSEYTEKLIKLSNTSDLYMGIGGPFSRALGGWAVDEWPGILDEVRISNIARTPNQVENINLIVGHQHAFKHDTVSVPVEVEFPIGKAYSSCQFTLSAFEHQGLRLLSLDTAETITGSSGWNFQYNDTDSSVIIALAGATDIFGGGKLFTLKFLVDGDPVTTVPINIISAVFNTGSDPVVRKNGGVDILQPLPGDVDLNGAIQAYDASLILKYLVGMETLDHCELSNADVTSEGGVSAADARSILRYVVGLIPGFPDTSLQNVVASGAVHFSPIHTQVGEVVSFALNLGGAQNVISSEGLLKYDRTALQYVGTGSSDMLDSFVANNTPGEIRFAGYSNAGSNQSGRLIVIKFKVLASSGRTTVYLNKLRLNEGVVVDNAGSSDIVLGVNDHPAFLPTQIALSQNYPNPFNPSTTISFTIPHDSRVVLKVYNILGEEVATLFDGEEIAGEHSVVWNAEGVPSGIYWYRMMSDDFSATRQMVLTK